MRVAIWSYFARHKNAFWHIATGIALFVAGWHLGRVMSPYYERQPIVFSDGAPVMADTAALNELREEGIALRTPVTEPVLDATVERPGNPAVAGERGALGTEGSERVFVGSVNSDLFHHTSCSTSQRIKEDNQIWFATVVEAEGAGYRPSKCTQDLLSSGAETVE